MEDSLVTSFRGNFLNFMGLGSNEPTAPPADDQVIFNPAFEDASEEEEGFQLPLLTGGDFYVPPAQSSPFTQVLLNYNLVGPQAKSASAHISEAVNPMDYDGGVEMDSFTAPSTTSAPNQAIPDYSVKTTQKPQAKVPQPRGKGAGRGERTKEGAPKYVEDVSLLQTRKKKKKKKVKVVVHRDGTRERIKEEDSQAMEDRKKDSAAEAEKQRRIRALKARREEALAKANASKPYFTISVTILEIALYILEVARTAQITSVTFGSNVWQWGGVNSAVVVDMGAKDASRILERNEWWRFFTPIFLHVSLTHIVFNLIMQIKVGMDLEKSFGSVRLFLLYILCGVGGNLVSSCFLFNQIQAGASGSLFGLLGLMLVDVFANWSKLRRPVCNLVIVIITIILSVGSGMMPGVDNFAHVGGLVVGLVGGFALLPHLVKGNKRCVRFLVVLITFPLLIALMATLIWLFYGYVGQGNSIECEWCEEINCAKSIMGEDWCNS